MSSIFISYRRKDASGHAGRIYDRLIPLFGKDQVFMDVDTLEPGQEFVEVIERTVAGSDVQIVVIGSQWLTLADEAGRPRLNNPEDFVRREIATALAKGVRVIPVLVQGASMPRPTDLPDELAELALRHAVDVSDERFDYDVSQLIQAIEKAVPETEGGGSRRKGKQRTGGMIQEPQVAVQRDPVTMGNPIVYAIERQVDKFLTRIKDSPLFWFVWVLSSIVVWVIRALVRVVAWVIRALVRVAAWAVRAGGALVIWGKKLYLQIRPTRWFFWVTWVWTSTVGWVLGVALAVTMLQIMVTIADEAVDEAVVWAVGGALTGVVGGTVQWLVLRRRVYRSGWWVLASTAAWAIVGVGIAVVVAEGMFATGDVIEALENVLSDPVPGAVTGAVVGAVVGLAQWLVLRMRVYRSGWWMVASTAGWATVGVGIGVAVAEGMLGGVFAGVGAGRTITWVALVWLLRQPLPKA